MFTSGHFIWLGVIAVLITAFMIVIKKCNVSQNFVQKTVFYLLIVLKLLHVSLSMKETGDGGYVLKQTQLSFHLCSIMIYTVFLINIVKNEKFIKIIKSFMVPAMLIGAAMALLIPTEGVDPSRARVWQYMLIHGVLVFYGLYLMVIERLTFHLRRIYQILRYLP